MTRRSPRTRLVLVVGSALASTLAAAFGAAGCGDDGAVVGPDASIDATVDRATVDSAVDAPTDRATIDVIDVFPDPSPWFLTDEIAYLCTRMAQCCKPFDAGAVDPAACKALLRNGVGGTLHELVENPALLEGGRIVLDQTAANACLAEVLTFSCPSLAGTERTKTNQDCAGALRGTQALGQPCNGDIECATGRCAPNGADGGSDAGTGTCAALSALGDPCGPGNEACQLRAYLGAPARCDVQTAADGGSPSLRCAPRLDAGAGCTFDWECASGACDPFTHVCASTIVTVNASLCASLVADAGGD